MKNHTPLRHSNHISRQHNNIHPRLKMIHLFCSYMIISELWSYIYESFLPGPNPKRRTESPKSSGEKCRRVDVRGLSDRHTKRDKPRCAYYDLRAREFSLANLSRARRARPRRTAPRAQTIYRAGSLALWLAAAVPWDLRSISLC